MRQYLDLLSLILERGADRPDRTGTGTRSVFRPPRLEFDLAQGFPLVTTKTVKWRPVVRELQWFLGGHTDVFWLQARRVHIWDAWEKPDGTIGPGYGKQLRAWDCPAPGGQRKAIDQVQALIDGIKTDPFGRRHVLSTWNVADLPEMALAPCHGLATQFYVDTGPGHRPAYLSCSTYQRSADAFIGLPFNIASYALQLHIVAALAGLQPARLVYDLGDAHLYQNHLDQARLQLTREPRRLPVLEMPRPEPTVDDYADLPWDDFRLNGYDPHSPIAAEVAV